MPVTNSTKARTHFFKLIEEVNMTHNPVFITGKKGNAVLISEEDFNAMQETLFLCSTPSMQNKLLAGMNTPLEECEEWIDEEE